MIMKKYVIVNKEWNSIACKVKNGGRHYRQPIDDIGKGLVVVETTKGRAERERDYLNANYNKGWEIKEVQNAEDKSCSETIFDWLYEHGNDEVEE